MQMSTSDRIHFPQKMHSYPIKNDRRRRLAGDICEKNEPTINISFDFTGKKG